MTSSTSKAADSSNRLDYFHPDVVKKFETAVATHQAGDFQTAENAYLEILRLTVDHPGALNLIGALHHQKGDNAKAVDFLTKAIAVAPENADFHTNLGAAYYGLGDHENAEECFREALSYQPDNATSNVNMASVLMDQGRLESAYDFARKAFDAVPGNFKYAKKLGEICRQINRFDEAAEAFAACIRVDPKDAETTNSLGYSYERLGKCEDAEKYYRKALGLLPNSPEIANNLAGMLSRLGAKDEARKYFDQALAAAPEDWNNAVKRATTYLNAGDIDRALKIFEQIKDAHADDDGMWSAYGSALSKAEDVEGAEQAFKKSLEINPDSYETWNNRATNLAKRGRYDEAVEQYKKAIELSPTYPDAFINLCLTLSFLNRLDEAYMYAHMTLSMPAMREGSFGNPVKVFRALCDFDALDETGDIFELAEDYRNSDIISSFLAMLPETSTAEQAQRLADLHFYWGENLALPEGADPVLPPPPKKKAGNSKLKIGIVSSDLRNHSVANFVLPILRHYDRSQFEIHCFAPYGAEGDTKQATVKELVDDFYVFEGGNYRDAAEVMQNRGMDVLFDLNGFTRDTMIESFCYRPAPVQIYWLGYPFTTGLPQMDHILVDPYVVPENTDWLVEEPLVLPETWLCADSFRGESIVDKLPVETSGKLTFGTLNNTYKFTREAVTVWATIMNEFEDSEFLVVRPEADSMILQNKLREHFARCGVAPERIKFINNKRADKSHFWYYNLIDISLDTFPQTGGTTTCDALWMGVPVISLVGPSMHQRVSYSMLENAGCGELACFSLEEYMGKAVMLGNDIASLREYRENLRPALLNSPLCQGERFAQNFQDAVVGAYEKSGA